MSSNFGGNSQIQQNSLAQSNISNSSSQSNNQHQRSNQNYLIQKKREGKWNQSQLLLSILIKPELGHFHNIIKSTVYENESKLATGSLTGDIVLWDYYNAGCHSQNSSQQRGSLLQNSALNQENQQSRLIPYQILIPCLSQTVGRVTCLQFIDNPLIRQIDNTRLCLMSVHLDNRVRLWDVQDGRCFNISPHNIFPGNQEIFLCQALRPNFSRFYLFAGSSMNLYLFDTWKMKQLTHIQLSDQQNQIVGLRVSFQTNRIYVLDSKNVLYILGIGSLDKDKFNIYDTYIQDQDNINKQLKQEKLQIQYKLDLKVLDTAKSFDIDEDSNTLSVVYSFQINVYKLDTIIEKMKEQVEEEKIQQEKQKYVSHGFQNFSENNYNFNNENYQQQMEELEKMKQQEKERLEKQIKLRYIQIASYKDYKYMHVKSIKVNKKTYFMIESEEGSNFILSQEGLKMLFDVIEISYKDDISFSFGGFSFYKSSGGYYATLNVRLFSMLTRGSENSQDYIKQKGYNLSCYCSRDHVIFSYDINQTKFESFSAINYIQENKDYIDVLKNVYNQQLQNEKLQQQQDQGNQNINDVLSENQSEIMKYKSVKCNGYVLEYYQVQQYNNQSFASMTETDAGSVQEQISANTEYVFQNQQEGPSLKSAKNIFHPQFKHDFAEAFEEQLEDDTITITLICFIDKKEPILFVGTQKGTLYGFRLVYDFSRSYYQVYKLEIEQDDSPIQYIHFLRNTLIVSQQNGGLTILKLDKMIDILRQDLKSYKGLEQSTMIQSQINGGEEAQHQQKKFIITSMEPLIQNFENLNMPVKRIQKIRIFQSLKNDQFSQEMVQSGKKLLKSQFALIQQNNNVSIYSTLTNSIEYELRDPGQGSIYSIFCHCVMDYYVVLTSNGYLHFWSMGSGRFERTEPFEKFYSLFDLKSLLSNNFQGVEEYNNYSIFKKENKSISECHSLLEYNNRYIEHLVNLFEESSKKTRKNKHSYESLGDLRNLEVNPKDSLHIIWALQERKDMCYLSNSQKTAMSILKVRMNEYKSDAYYNVNFMLFVDCKKHNQNIKDLFENSSDPYEHRIFSYAPFLFPWGIKQKLDQEVGKVFNYKRPVVQYNVGVVGLANSFSFPLNKKLSDMNILSQQESSQIQEPQLFSNNHFTISSFQTTNIGISLLLYINILTTFRSKKVYEIMIELSSYFTKNKRKIAKDFKHISIPALGRFFCDDTYDLLTSANNLLISVVCNNEADMTSQQSQFMDFLQINFNYYTKKHGNNQNIDQQLTLMEVVWLVILSYLNSHGQHVSFGAETCIKRVIQGINIRNCLQNPNLVAPCMKILMEGIKIWKNQISDFKSLMQHLMYIYFHYNTTYENLDMLKDTPNSQKSKSLLDEFLNQSEVIRKKMKLITIKTIISLAGLSLSDFFALIKKEIVHVDRHPLYPCSIIDIIRNYIKSELKISQKHLPFFIEIILRSLDPNNPLYRKISHHAATNALHTIFRLYKNVSFHQKSQKFVVGTQESQILIYDLRTATKWRVLDGHEGPVTVVKFDNSGKHIASYSLADNSIRIWRVGSTGFFGSILNMSGKHQKKIQLQVKVPKNIEFNRISLSWSDDDKMVQIMIGDDKAMEFKAV